VDINERVRQFIIESFYLPVPAKRIDHVSFLDSGLVDSTFRMCRRLAEGPVT
jgi:hypothetical protein